MLPRRFGLTVETSRASRRVASGPRVPCDESLRRDGPLGESRELEPPVDGARLQIRTHLTSLERALPVGERPARTPRVERGKASLGAALREHVLDPCPSRRG